MVGATGKISENCPSKSVGVSSLTHTELVTVLVEIEACINSRPLTFVGDDIEAR